MNWSTTGKGDNKGSVSLKKMKKEEGTGEEKSEKKT